MYPSAISCLMAGEITSCSSLQGWSSSVGFSAKTATRGMEIMKSRRNELCNRRTVLSIRSFVISLATSFMANSPERVVMRKHSLSHISSVSPVSPSCLAMYCDKLRGCSWAAKKCFSLIGALTMAFTMPALQSATALSMALRAKAAAASLGVPNSIFTSSSEMASKLSRSGLASLAC